jgi:tetratricopeptide (TPR) repeat protein
MELTEILQRKLEHQLNVPGLDEEAIVFHRCAAARELAESGDYEAARQAMGELWQRVGQRPVVDGLSRLAQAEVLLRAGALSGWIGSARQLDGAQETAKDMITESILLFSQLGETAKEAEAYVDLGICYWRGGAFSEARTMLTTALERVDGGVQRARALMNLAIIEMAQSRHNEAVQNLREAAPIFETLGNQELMGRNHLQLALAYKKLFASEKREDYLDLALVEGTAAKYHFEQTGNKRYEAIVENNLGSLYTTAGQFPEAGAHLDRARRLFVALGDRVNVARVDDSRAVVFLAEGRLKQAEVAARDAVNLLEQGEESAVLAEALTTLGRVQAQLRNYAGSRSLFERAANVAQAAGDVDGAGAAYITLLEELSDTLSPKDLLSIYKLADAFLEKNSEREMENRLRRCARFVLEALTPLGAAFDYSVGESCNLDEVTRRFVKQFEATAIKRALDAEGGSISRAARRLGLTHQGLDYKLTERHAELASSRKPKRARRRPLFKNNS